MKIPKTLEYISILIYTTRYSLFAAPELSLISGNVKRSFCAAKRILILFSQYNLVECQTNINYNEKSNFPYS
jgi:hypothetical protein